jgi:hypothetical protein
MERFPAGDEAQPGFIKRVIDDGTYHPLMVGGRQSALRRRTLPTSNCNDPKRLLHSAFGVGDANAKMDRTSMCDLHIDVELVGRDTGVGPAER